MSVKPTIEEFINLSLAQLLLRLSAGLSESQAEWVKTALEMYILPDFFYRGDPQSTNELHAQVEIATEDLLIEGEQLDPVKRMDWLIEKSFNSRLVRLSDESFHLALASKDHGVADVETNRRGTELIDQLNLLVQEMEKYAPEVRRKLAAVISETLLDSYYTMGEREIISLRLARFLRSEKDAPST